MTFHEKFQSRDWVSATVQNGIREALIKHKALGVAIAVWKDGQVVLIPPEEIEIPGPGSVLDSRLDKAG